MSLRARLTLWFLLLAIVPSLALSLFVLRQLVSTVEWWNSAGAEDALTSSMAVARTSLRRLENGLDQSAPFLFDLSRLRPLALEPGDPDRLLIERYLRDTGLDLYQVYGRASPDSGWRQLADVPPSEVTRATPVDLAPEINTGRLNLTRSVQSRTGVLARVSTLPADSLHGGERMVAVGYALPEDFFLRLNELQLGMAIFQRLSIVGDLYKWYFRLLVALVLLVVTVIAVFAARMLARHVSEPVAQLAESFSRVDGGTAVRVEPRGAPEVRRLGEAFNAMTGRLVRAREQLARAERAAAWQGVARQVAHEIRNPLTALGQALYIIGRDVQAMPEYARDRVAHTMAIMKRELDSLAELADSFSMLGTMPDVRPGPVDLNALVDSVTGVWPWPHVRVEKTLDPARPVARGDERQLRRVLRNLIKNASESQPDGGSVRIRTGAGTGPATVAVVVEDEGPGMEPEVLAHVYEAGFSTKDRGSGVGLTVTRRVVEQHGGTIEMDSIPGRGTRVTVALPRHAAHGANDADGTRDAHAASDTHGTHESPGESPA